MIEHLKRLAVAVALALALGACADVSTSRPGGQGGSTLTEPTNFPPSTDAGEQPAGEEAPGGPSEESGEDEDGSESSNESSNESNDSEDDAQATPTTP